MLPFHAITLAQSLAQKANRKTANYLYRFNAALSEKAEVAKLADAPDLGSGSARSRGSSPLLGTFSVAIPLAQGGADGSVAALADDRLRFARERKVRTPSDSRPWRIRGRVGRKSDATDSVTENRPPAIFRKRSRGQG